jgi:hypothetical protein
MIRHIFLPVIDLAQVSPRKEYQEWLLGWLNSIEDEIEDGNVSASICLQAIISEIVLFDELTHDWQAIFEDVLTDPSGAPLAYSKEYGKRLYQFENQWHQTTIHAIHTRFWVDGLYNQRAASSEKYVDLIKGFVQPNGWIYNPKVSQTQLATRMKSEYLMSFAFALEILKFAGIIELYQKNFESTLSAQPFTGYLSAEYFRLRALELLGSPQLAPVMLKNVVFSGEAGQGYCDFAVSQKVDDYMGTAKRTSRDVAVHSPLSGLHAKYISQHCDKETQNTVKKRLENFRLHLLKEPFDIKAFQIRDVQIPFGTALSPLEVFAASLLTQQNTK